MSAEDVIHSYSESIRQTLKQGECLDSHGNTIDDLRPAEFTALFELLAGVAASRGNPLHCSIKLKTDARKHVIAFACVLGIAVADARIRGRSILFLAADSTSEAGAQLEYHAMFPFTISTHVQFATWDELQPRPENNFHLADLRKFWIIGDLDWSDQAGSGPGVDLKIAAVRRVLADGSCPTVLLHKEGKATLVPFPPANT